MSHKPQGSANLSATGSAMSFWLDLLSNSFEKVFAFFKLFERQQEEKHCIFDVLSTRVTSSCAFVDDSFSSFLSEVDPTTSALMDTISQAVVIENELLETLQRVCELFIDYHFKLSRSISLQRTVDQQQRAGRRESPETLEISTYQSKLSECRKFLWRLIPVFDQRGSEFSARLDVFASAFEKQSREMEKILTDLDYFLSEFPEESSTRILFGIM